MIRVPACRGQFDGTKEPPHLVGCQRRHHWEGSPRPIKAVLRLSYPSGRAARINYDKASFDDLGCMKKSAVIRTCDPDTTDTNSGTVFSEVLESLQAMLSF